MEENSANAIWCSIIIMNQDKTNNFVLTICRKRYSIEKLIAAMGAVSSTSWEVCFLS